MPKESISRTKNQVLNTIKIFNKLLNDYKFDEIAISYNGGKDCLVMLVIYLSSLYDYYSKNLEELSSKKWINTVYINYEKQFQEVIEFIEYSREKYNLSITEYQTDLKTGFKEYLKLNPEIKCIIVGARRSDPYCSNLDYFAKTDSGWPEFIRVHPVIDWQYDDIWTFLKNSSIKYCSLYDKGFTSLGGVDSTIRNPNLKKEGSGNYLPAYELHDDDLERDGRYINSEKTIVEIGGNPSLE